MRLTLNTRNEIVALYTDAEEVGDWFLSRNTTLTSLYAPKLQKVGDCFLYRNTALQELHAPKLQEATRWGLQ